MGWLGLDVLNALSAGALSTKNLAVAVGAQTQSIRHTCRVLRDKELIVSCCNNTLHELTVAGKAALSQGRQITSGPVRGSVRRQDSLRARAWRAMRIRHKFSVPELCSMLCDGTATNPEGNLEQYVLPLLRAGYLAALPCGRDGAPRYLLVQDTGPLPPAWNKLQRCLTDPNTGAQITLEGSYARRVATTAGGCCGS